MSPRRSGCCSPGACCRRSAPPRRSSPAFDAIGAGRTGPTRLWTAASVFGIAVGPAIGGAVTQLLDWRVIFLAQAPAAILAAIAFARAPRTAAGPPPARLPVLPAAALALVSAALTGVLFLLVLMLVAGWSLEPLAAAAVVSVLPVAALAGARIGGPDGARAAAGCLLVGAGILMLAFVPGASAAWVILPQIAAGLGMGLALGALPGGLLPERTAAEAARLLAVRHWGITLALLVLAPVTASALESGIADARERSAAAVLDAELPPREKIDLVAPVTADLDPEDPRGSLEAALDKVRASFRDGDDAAAFDAMAERLDGTLVRAVDEAFRPAFLITGTLAVLAALLLVVSAPGPSRRRLAPAAALVAVAVALPLLQALAAPAAAPARGEVRDPCESRDLPSTGGLDGFIQDAALVALDRAACEFGSSREELALAIADDEAARAYEREHGADPRSARDLLGGILP